MKYLTFLFVAMAALTSCSNPTTNTNENMNNHLAKGIEHVALFTPQLEQTIRFYKEAFGAEEVARFATQNRMCWLKIGDSTLELCESDAKADGHFEHIAIGCDDVDALYAETLTAGATSEVAPKDICLQMSTPYEARIAFVRGINGERIELFAKR